MADTLGPVIALYVPSGTSTLGPTTDFPVPSGSITLGPFTTLDMPVGSITIGPLTEVNIWSARPVLLRTEQLRAPLIGLRRSLNLNTTTDQAILVSAKRYIIRRVVVTGATNPVTSAAGGLYTGAGKTGTAIVPASQNYGALSAPTTFLETALHASTSDTVFSNSTLYFSLTTANGVPADATIYVYGDTVEA